jgi:hypothetical protein
MSSDEYKRCYRMKFKHLFFMKCANCNAHTLYQNVETNAIRCIECSYCEQSETKTHVTERLHVSASDCSYDAKSIAARIIARSKARVNVC